jgi:hypothetical protein
MEHFWRSRLSHGRQRIDNRFILQADERVDQFGVYPLKFDALLRPKRKADGTYIASDKVVSLTLKQRGQALQGARY